MAQNDIDDVLDHLRRIKSGGNHLRRIKSGGNLGGIKIVQIEILEMHLRFLRTFIKYHHVLLPCSLVNLTKNAKTTVKMLHLVFGGIPDERKPNLNLERLVSLLLEFSEGNTSLRYYYNFNDSNLSKYMDRLGKNLNDVLMCLKWKRFDRLSTIREKHQSVLVSKQVKIIQKKMRFLRYLYATEINSYVNHEKLEGLETRIQFMADSVGQFCLAFWVNVTESEDDTYIWRKLPNEDEDDTDSDEDEDHTYLLCLIVLVELEINGELKASKFSQSRAFKENKLPKRFSHHLHSLLMYLRNKKLKNFPNCVSARNIDMAIELLLVFVNADLSNHVINGNWLDEVMEKVGAIAGDVLYVVQKLLSSSINKDDTSKINVRSIQILEKTKDLMAQVETYYKSLKFTPSQFPAVGGLSFLDSLLRKLNEMSSLDFLMKPLVGNLEKELSFLTSILEKELSSLSFIFRDVTMDYHENEILKNLQRRTINMAYEAEISINSILAQYDVFWHSFCSLPTILKEIKQINVEVTEMWPADIALKLQYAVAPSKHLPTRHSNLVSDEETVGFEIAEEKLIRYLTLGTNELDVIPIVGMGGQGKTTCARKLYNKDSIVSHFDVRAWCIISQTYNRRELLQQIFSQVTDSKDKGYKDDILADELRKSLMGKRYLIVLDDMWDGIAWDDLRLSFPDVGNRSRIVVTTRLEEVAKQVKYHTDLYFLPFLTLGESLKLLQKKVFQQEDCPPELQDVSLAVAKRCKGLPVVIVLAAGIIRKGKMEESLWNEVESALFSYLGESEEYSHATMHLSYDKLPDHLRPCLLYMGMFPEDEIIPVSKLIRLWIAEGFVQNIESGKLEETAEDYLMDLIRSNVVMVSRRRYNGKVKYCQVHDVVHHFCLEKSREEKFMLAVQGSDIKFQPSGWKESRVSFSFTERSSKFASLGSKTRKPFDTHLRSLITTKRTSENKYSFHCWKPIRQVREVRLLKVLDLSSINVDYVSSAALKRLIHLKYLAVQIFDEFHFHPESHLPHLETLIVRSRNRTVLPEIFWKMEKLRHVDIYTQAKFDLEYKKQGMFEESSKLENLRILREVEFPFDRVDLLLGRCPNLQQLDIRFEVDKDSAEPFCLKLENLTQLQSLDLSFDRYIIPSELQLPSNLKELILCGTSESAMAFIAGLPCLEYLQLQYTYQSEEWCLGDIIFPKLKFLKLLSLDISRWDATEESFPLLETLVIDQCSGLEEIPDSFAEIPTLRQIKVHWCNESLEASALQIKEQVKENQGCDRIDLIIKKNRAPLWQL